MVTSKLGGCMGLLGGWMTPLCGWTGRLTGWMGRLGVRMPRLDACLVELGGCSARLGGWLVKLGGCFPELASDWSDWAAGRAFWSSSVAHWANPSKRAGKQVRPAPALSPGGTIGNSPAFQRGVGEGVEEQAPAGAKEAWSEPPEISAVPSETVHRDPVVGSNCLNF